ncbi:GNAT family N-acetyltransferase [Amycolatopsis sp. cmx-4-68]|uniref:GNAT family N-acetyltransferase n=1 Tax=Amycolatopsis sp. cmx-4-68 TaxID=2790938 RepID=UPI003979403F
MPIVTVRHFTEEDVPLRTELLREARFTANLTDFAVGTGDDGLTARQHRTITEEQRTKRIFTVCGPRGRVMGFAWITSIDWRAQRCELSFGVLPRDRGLGGFAVYAVHKHLRDELNMRVIVNQVLTHNTMFLSAEALEAQHQVRCERDSYTVGEWRTACYWTLSEEDIRAHRESEGERRRELAERIRARIEARS